MPDLQSMWAALTETERIGAVLAPPVLVAIALVFAYRLWRSDARWLAQHAGDAERRDSWLRSPVAGLRAAGRTESALAVTVALTLAAVLGYRAAFGSLPDEPARSDGFVWMLLVVAAPLVALLGVAPLRGVAGGLFAWIIRAALCFAAVAGVLWETIALDFFGFSRGDVFGIAAVGAALGATWWGALDTIAECGERRELSPSAHDDHADDETDSREASTHGQWRRPTHHTPDHDDADHDPTLAEPAAIRWLNARSRGAPVAAALTAWLTLSAAAAALGVAGGAASKRASLFVGVAAAGCMIVALLGTFWRRVTPARTVTGVSALVLLGAIATGFAWESGRLSYTGADAGLWGPWWWWAAPMLAPLLAAVILLPRVRDLPGWIRVPLAQVAAGVVLAPFLYIVISRTDFAAY